MGSGVSSIPTGLRSSRAGHPDPNLGVGETWEKLSPGVSEERQRFFWKLGFHSRDGCVLGQTPAELGGVCWGGPLQRGEQTLFPGEPIAPAAQLSLGCSHIHQHLPVDLEVTLGKGAGRQRRRGKGCPSLGRPDEQAQPLMWRWGLGQAGRRGGWAENLSSTRKCQRVRTLCH